MKKMVDKYPDVLRDNLHGCRAFENVPHQEIEIDNEVPPVFRSYVRNTPIHLKETSKGFIQKLVDHDIIAPQPNWSP